MTDDNSTRLGTIADKIMDSLTDIVGIVAIFGIIYAAGINPSDMTLAAITSIALGKRYLKNKGA